MSSNYYEIALALVRAGLSVLPIKPAEGDADKRPALGSWKVYQSRLAEERELASWFRGYACRGIAAIGGPVSGGLECIDFDEPGLFEEWAVEVDKLVPDLLDRCVIVKTPKVGMHVWYRCSAVEGSQLLAKRPPTANELRDNPKKDFVKRIETRGTGGYALVPGSARECHRFCLPYLYHTERGLGDLTRVQEISVDERDILFRLARSYSLLEDEAPVGEHPRLSQKGSGGLSIGDDYERKASWQDILEPHGWHVDSGTWENGHLCRAGKKNGTSATVGFCKGKDGEPLLYVFSTDAGMPTGCYGKFRAYARLNHGGDHKAAAIQLGHRGFGDQTPRAANAAKGPSKGQGAEEQPPATAPKPWTVKPSTNVPLTMDSITATDLIALELPPPRYAISDLLCEGLTILGGRPKQGKSWLALLMAWAVASGESLDGREVTGGEVLYLALEDTKRRLQKRLKLLRDAAWPYPERLTLCTSLQRADQGGLYLLNEWLAGSPGRRFIIIDTLAKFRKPQKGSGNNYADDYEALADIKALVDHYGASVLIIHHTRKLQAEDPFDELSGTLAIAGAADGLMVLDHKRGDSSGRLFLTGRDIPELTIQIAFHRDKCRWVLSPSEEGINTDGRGMVRGDADSKLDQCCIWLKQFVREFAYPSKEILDAAKKMGFEFDHVKKAKARLGVKGTGEVQSVNLGGSREKQDWWSGTGPPEKWIKRPHSYTPSTSSTTGTAEEDIPD